MGSQREPTAAGRKEEEEEEEEEEAQERVNRVVKGRASSCK